MMAGAACGPGTVACNTRKYTHVLMAIIIIKFKFQT
jgi:hypothetical protein